MVQRVHTVLEDDLDGSAADETVSFALDGTGWEIDLSRKNAAALRDALAVYVASGRRAVGRSGARTARTRAPSGTSASEVRLWARAQGFVVSDRGRVPADVKAAYEAAH